MAVPSTSFHIDMYYYLNDNLSPIIKTGVCTSGSYTTIEPASIETVLGVDVPPHMTFLGWYSPECDLTIDMNTETLFDVTNVSYTIPFNVYAKWEINTKFNYKDKTLFDFSQGGVNVAPETLAKGVTAYDANGMLITGTKEV